MTKYLCFFVAPPGAIVQVFSLNSQDALRKDTPTLFVKLRSSLRIPGRILHTFFSEYSLPYPTFSFAVYCAVGESVSYFVKNIEIPPLHHQRDNMFINSIHRETPTVCTETSCMLSLLIIFIISLYLYNSI
jgi:hypothetical protein